MSMKATQPPPVEREPADPSPSRSANTEMVLSAAQIEQIQEAIKDVSYGKLTITIKNRKLLGYMLEKSEKFC